MLKPLLIVIFGVAASLCAAQPFSIVILGDMPYGPPEKVYPPYERLIGAINEAGPDLVIHVGDTKSGGSPCSDRRLAEQRAYLDRFEAPTLYTPGDNEWTDCHRAPAGGHDPRERLAHIRETYFDTPAQSFGAHPVAVEHQGAEGYPENVRLMMNDVMIVTAHVVGSNNGFAPRDAATVQEHFERDAANRAWLRTGFAAARAAGARALVLAIHGDMFEFGFGPPWDAEGFLGHSGFARFARVLTEEASAFARPVLLTYGDSHRFEMIRPFPRSAPGVMALETFGARNMHAVHVRVTPGAGYPFSVQPLINPAQPLAPRP
ncbi:metallophosphoesterase [Roseovarius sp. D22-M7]|uniref:metallophosphoesterase n=1 Tax=Roseovarius sp. D22-M7 TaxID=3127116 RepID=UPI0030104FA6